MEFPVVVLRRPCDHLPPDPEVEAYGGILDDRRGGEAPIKGGGVDEGFEGGAGLASRLYGAIELAALEIVPADHGLDGPIPRVEGRQCPFQLRILLQR